MKTSLKWLKTMVNAPVDTPEAIKDFAERLDLTGTAVESIDTVGAALDGIVVGHILTREAHPEADSLWVTTVDVGAFNLGADGAPAPLQIVCGAQNFNAGDKVPVALVGATMPGGMQIKKAKLRGIESRGMNCSARELGLGDDHEGLLILPADAPVGAAIADYLGLSDTVIDLEITPNRPDCMSMLGIAREVGAVYDLPYSVGREVPAAPKGKPVDELVAVKIDDAERCPRYTSRIIQGVTVGPSPAWLVERVTAAGARSINNIVDATNYIMFELGQPLHAFDFDTFALDKAGKAQVGVRAAAAGELFTTLDEIERTLSPDVTVIYDGNAQGGSGATIALAGVMGGAATEVTDATTTILLESASFSPAHTSRTSRNLQLFSESAARFERGVDAATCEEFSLRAANLIAEIAGGTVCEGVVDVYPAPKAQPVLQLRVGKLYDLIGAEIELVEIIGILTRLGCHMACHDRKDGSVPENSICHIMHGSDCVTEKLAASMHDVVIPIKPPSWRPDLEREIDLYEEVLRIWGMDRVEKTLPGGRGRIGLEAPEQALRKRIGASLRALGLNETMTYTFAAPDDQERLSMPLPEHQQPVELLNPMNVEQSVMRRSLMPGLLRSVAYNMSRGVENVQLYEDGTVYAASEGHKLPKERALISGVLCGSWAEASWNAPEQALDFFDGKGIVEGLARELALAKLRFKPLAAEDASWLQPGRAAEVYAGSLKLGWVGEIHPLVSAAFDIEAPVVAFELERAALLNAARPARDYKDVSPYPPVALDLAVVVAEDVTAERIIQTITSAAGNLLDEVRLFDVYRDDEKVGAGKKSLAFSLVYRAVDRTLTSEEVEKLHSKILRKVAASTGAELRA
ncbi:MAG: phenylalanine--tRNA ligase subunit beta [Coriobacteriales bacterium]|jgi:phenylalanyl-tRNA synthetase beta chain|nr:phenylalanine--tRNA ligase subunit beta [Coriobacteriales bacterium]